MTATPMDAERARLVHSFCTGDVSMLADLVTDGVLWLAGRQPPWLGRLQLIEELSGFFDRYSYELSFSNTMIVGDNCVAVERSAFRSTVDGREDAGPSVHEGTVVIHWVRKDGWRIGAYLDLENPLLR